MLLVVALLVIYAAGALLVASMEKSWLVGGASVAAAIAAIGTAVLRPWSRHLVYALTFALIGKLGYSLYAARVAGFFDMFGDKVLWSLLPSCVLTVLFILACWIVRRQFSTPSNATATTA
jgi:hypothetical protein